MLFYTSFYKYVEAGSVEFLQDHPHPLPIVSNVVKLDIVYFSIRRENEYLLFNVWTHQTECSLHPLKSDPKSTKRKSGGILSQTPKRYFKFQTVSVWFCEFSLIYWILIYKYSRIRSGRNLSWILKLSYLGHFYVIFWQFVGYFCIWFRQSQRLRKVSQFRGRAIESGKVCRQDKV